MPSVVFFPTPGEVPAVNLFTHHLSHTVTDVDLKP